MSVVYKTNPWHLPEFADYPIWPFHDIDFWHLGNLIQEVRIQEEAFPTGISFHRKSDAYIRLRDAFLCAGILMSPAIYNGGARAWAFFLEHAESLRASSGALRVKSDCVHWEERVRTIFSERFGLGLAGWLLWNSYDVLHIADAGPFIAKTISDPASPYNKISLTSLGLYGQNGGLKPDLLCLTRLGECVIAESKGAIGPPSKLSSAKKKGKKQVENVNPNGVNVRTHGGRLVFATNLRHEGENPQPTKDSSIMVVDPTDSSGALEIEVSADEITLHSYCKLLSFCGMTNIARTLLRGNSFDGVQELRQTYIEVGELKVFPLLIRSGQVIGLEARVAEVLFHNPKDLFEATSEVLPKNRDDAGLVSDEQVLIFPNGVVFGNVD